MEDDLSTLIYILFDTYISCYGHTEKQKLLLHGLCQAAAIRRVLGELGFHRRSRVQRRSPLEMRGRLLELRRRARPRLPSAILIAQH